jgi:hypothetical protein
VIAKPIALSLLDNHSDYHDFPPAPPLPTFLPQFDFFLITNEYLLFILRIKIILKAIKE